MMMLTDGDDDGEDAVLFQKTIRPTRLVIRFLHGINGRWPCGWRGRRLVEDDPGAVEFGRVADELAHAVAVLQDAAARFKLREESAATTEEGAA